MEECHREAPTIIRDRHAFVCQPFSLTPHPRAQPFDQSQCFYLVVMISLVATVGRFSFEADLFSSCAGIPTSLHCCKYMDMSLYQTL